jgi:hypothetical protein
MSTEVSRQDLYNALREDAPHTHGTLYGYHSMSAIWDCGPNTIYRFGIEAEKEDDAGCAVACWYQGDREDLLPHSWRAERDGSLGHEGFELISPIYNLKTDKWKQDLSTPVLNYLIHSKTGYRCGGHITISVNGKDQDWYVNKAAQIIPLLYALYPKRAKRRGYARFYKKGDYHDRYNAINLGNTGRMEIRIFSGIKHLKQLEWRVKLLQILFTTEKYDDLKWDTVYKDLLNVHHGLGRHIFELYGKKYGEKVMLSAAYAKAFENQGIEWRTYSKVRTLIPTGVRSQLIVQPDPTLKSNSKQLTLDVCDYSQETTGEA